MCRNNNDVVNVLERIKEKEEIAAELNAEIASLKDEVKAYMTKKKISELTLVGTKWAVFWNEVVRNEFDKKAFEAEHPRLYKKFLVQKTSRPFRAKETKEIRVA